MAKSGLFSPACKFDDAFTWQAARSEHIQITLSGYQSRQPHSSMRPRSRSVPQLSGKYYLSDLPDSEQI